MDVFLGVGPEETEVREFRHILARASVRHVVDVRLQTANDNFNDKLAGNIGQDIPNRFVVTVDCKHAVLYFEKTTLSNKPASFHRSGMLVDYNHGSDEIKTVFPGSPAETAGLREGDRILAINGTNPSDDPNDPLLTQPVGTVLHLQVRRGETSWIYDITLREVL